MGMSELFLEIDSLNIILFEGQEISEYPKVEDQELNEKAKRILSFTRKCFEDSKNIIAIHSEARDLILSLREPKFDFENEFLLILGLNLRYLNVNSEPDLGTVKKKIFEEYFQNKFPEDKNYEINSFEDCYIASSKYMDNSPFREHLLDFYIGFDSQFKVIKKLSDELVKIIEKNLREVEGIRDYYLDFYSNLPQDSPIKNDSGDEVKILLSLFMPLTGFYNIKFGSISCFITNIFWYEMRGLTEDSLGVEWTIESLKIISDPVRFKTLILCNEYPRYLSELTRIFKLKPSSMSYHLNALYKSGYLKTTENSFENKKIYYITNFRKLAMLIREMKRLFPEDR